MGRKGGKEIILCAPMKIRIEVLVHLLSVVAESKTVQCPLRATPFSSFLAPISEIFFLPPEKHLFTLSGHRVQALGHLWL